MIELEDKNPSGKENESSKRNSEPGPALRSELARGPDQLQETKLRHRRATNEKSLGGNPAHKTRAMNERRVWPRLNLSWKG
jgi:hypothetical protein